MGYWGPKPRSAQESGCHRARVSESHSEESGCLEEGCIVKTLQTLETWLCASRRSNALLTSIEEWYENTPRWVAMVSLSVAVEKDKTYLLLHPAWLTGAFHSSFPAGRLSRDSFSLQQTCAPPTHRHAMEFVSHTWACGTLSRTWVSVSRTWGCARKPRSCRPASLSPCCKRKKPQVRVGTSHPESKASFRLPCGKVHRLPLYLRRIWGEREG